MDNLIETFDEDDKKQTVKPKAATKAAAAASTGCPYLDGDYKQSDEQYTDCYYHDYLQLDKILNANEPRSAQYAGKASHDEHLFITIHQAYEIWFKQVLYELDAITACFGHADEVLEDRQLLKIVYGLQRINKILKLLVMQWGILDTMTPMNYLDFRKYLKPASGFQSWQFRILENKLGLDQKQRMRKNITKGLRKTEEELIATKCKANQEKTLFDVVQRWLERFPYLRSASGAWCFWKEYKTAVKEYILTEKQLYSSHVAMDENMKKQLEENAAKSTETFNGIFDEKRYEELRKNGKIRISYTAMKAALMIMLYREEPQLQMPFRVLELTMDMEQILAQWRNDHALMVHRMLGSKMGTGGSSGYHYLRTTVHHKVFVDLLNLSTYMLPKSNLPPLPKTLTRFMEFPMSPKSVSSPMAVPKQALDDDAKEMDK